MSLKSPDYIESLHNEYFPKLFRELKADWQSPREKDKSYINTLLVKTFSYRRVESQSVCFVIGRKGSGKSTVADAMSIRHRDNLRKTEFNELGALNPQGGLSKDVFNCRIIIHPIFCDYLQLDTSNNELVLVTTWEYLKEMESLLFQSSNSFLL